ncbi:MAG: YicC family protein [Chitinivibrionales bacterium]|nr:YicC family protein [Chitinivibrionales bacterium]MBD3396787.1 YicC family protein [Chitinivibrionales bacterium]
MSLRSMTGFGQAENQTPSGGYRVEIRGVNNRYLDVQIRSPRAFANLDQRMKKTLSESISRGSVSLNISWTREDEDGGLTWDRNKVAAYVKIFREITSEHGLTGDISLGNLLGFSDLVKVESPEYPEETLWKHVKPALAAAVADFQRSREREGSYIVRDLKKMLKALSAALAKIEKRAPARLSSYSASLAKRIEGLAGGAVDASRVAAEVALMTDKLDISEECTRLKAHVEKFAADFASHGPAGKRMTFILQEMNREANTIASKANDTAIAHLSVSLKESIEKIREQVQNIE